ncbi:MAG: hypothetical protein JST54_02935 [Deltaproteobacteria bacterium]|nr:hypothetical protein [Deltaproteobacteria bacterium]
MRRLVFALIVLAPGLALAQGAAAGTPAPAPVPAPAPAPAVPAPVADGDVKHDQGTVRTIDAQRGTAIVDCPNGPVTYDVSSAQLIDANGNAAGVAATGLKTGDKVRVTYVITLQIGRGAKASEVRILK